MELFDKFDREDLDGAMYAEPLYRYLNRSARPSFQKTRGLLQLWADRWPVLVDQQWLDRFRSDDDRHHLGAFFELYASALLMCQGYLLDREPESKSGKRPEFLVHRDSEEPFVLECRLAAGPEFGSAEQKRINRVYDAINRLHSPNFFVGVRVRESTVNDPPGAPLRSFLEARLAELDPDDVSGIPRWIWLGGGWKIEFTAIPKSPGLRAKPGIRPLGMPGGGAKWIAETIRPLITALESKAGRYGNLQMPYVIAVCALDVFVDAESFRTALFGDWIDALTLARGEVAVERRRDGFWFGKGGPQHHRVSAVLFVSHLRPWTVTLETPILYHNPWADHRLKPDAWLGPQVSLSLDSTSLESKEGESGAEILGLDVGWLGLYDEH